MSFDLGDPVPLSVEVRDAAGNLANATAVALTVTLPDGSPVTPTVGAPSPTGVYATTTPFIPTQVGRHVARWVATGTNASAYTDAFDVTDAGSDLVSLADAKVHLNIPTTSTTDDEEIRSFITAASVYLENRYGPLARQTFVETRTPTRSGALLLSHYPVISLTTVVGAYGYTATYDVSTLHVTDSGMLMPNFGGYWQGYYPLTVTYVAGLTTMPADVQKACLEVVAGLWETQRGGGSGGSPEALLQGAGEGEFVSGMGLVFWRVEKLMQPYAKPVVA